MRKAEWAAPGPIVLMAEAEHDKAVAALKEAGYIG